MRIETSKNNLPLSKVIIWGTNSKSSHFITVFDEKFVIHSNLFGVHPKWYKSFLKQNEIIESVEIECSLELEERTYISLLDSEDGKGYDIPALIYWTYRGFLYRYFNVPLPKRNIWSSDRLLLCLAIYGKLPYELTGQKIDEDELEMMTPDQLMGIIKTRIKNGEIRGYVIK